MAINLFCPGCKKTYQVKDELAGRRVKCPHGHTLTVRSKTSLPAANAVTAHAPAVPAFPKPLPQSESQPRTNALKPRSSGFHTAADDRFHLQCPRCEKRLTAARQYEGRQCKCPGCGSVIQVPSSKRGKIQSPPNASRWHEVPQGQCAESSTYYLAVLRQKRLYGAALKWTLYIDDFPVGRIGNGKSLGLLAKPGTHTIGVSYGLVKIPPELFEMPADAHCLLRVQVSSNTNKLEIVEQKIVSVPELNRLNLEIAKHGSAAQSNGVVFWIMFLIVVGSQALVATLFLFKGLEFLLNVVFGI